MYISIYKKAEYELVEKKSKFIASASPVYSEDEAESFINSIRKIHKDANHNVFAYRLGSYSLDTKTVHERQSDDGEPSGTAGSPVLTLLRGQSITNAVVVVTRYFGGTLLGTGGLVRAYGRCAAGAVEKAHVIEKIPYHKLSLSVDYSISGKIKHEIIQNKAVINKINYQSDVEFIIMLDKKTTDAFISQALEITGGNCKTIILQESYCAVINGEEVFIDR